MNGIFSNLFGFVGPYLQDIVVTVAVPGVMVWFWQLMRRWGIQIEDSRREAYTTTAQRVAGELFAALAAKNINLKDLVKESPAGAVVPNLIHPSMAAAIVTVENAVPDALKAFGLTNNPLAIGQKIIGTLGPMLAGAGGEFAIPASSPVAHAKPVVKGK